MITQWIYVLCTKIACYRAKLTHVISYLQTRVATTIYSQVNELQGTSMVLIFRTYWGTFSPMILVAYFPTSSGQLMPMIPRSHDLGSLQLPPTHVLHAHLAAPTTSSCCVSCWVTRMPWTVLRPSFRSCEVEPLTCTNCCALLNSHLRAGCQYLRCRISRQPKFSSAYLPNEFSCLASTFHRPVHVRQ